MSIHKGMAGSGIRRVTLGRLPAESLRDVEAGIRLVLAL